MENLVIKNGQDDIEFIHNPMSDSDCIEIAIFDSAIRDTNSIIIYLDQAKEIRDYLDNILKDR